MKYLYGLAELQPNNCLVKYNQEGILVKEDKWKIPIYRSAHKFLLEYEKISKIEIKIDTQTNYKLSAGKAIVGGVLTGGVGLLVGGMMGDKKKDTSKFIIIKYNHDDLGEIDVVFEDKNAEQTHSKLLKMKLENKNKIINSLGIANLNVNLENKNSKPVSANFWQISFGWFFLVIGILGFFNSPMFGIIFIILGVYMLPRLRHKVFSFFNKKDKFEK